VPSPLLSLVGSATGLLFSAQVQKAAFAVVHAEVGASSTEPGGEAGTAVATEVRPGIALRLTTPRTSATVTVSPRMYYQSPNVGDLGRPLFLAQADSGLVYQLRPELTWVTGAGVSYGEVDYLSATVVLDSPVAQNLSAPVMTLLTLRARTGLDYLMTVRHTFSAALVVDHTDYGEGGGESQPDNTTSGADLVQTYALTPRDSLLVPLLLRYSAVSDSPDWLTAGTGLGYRRALDLRTQFDAAAGITAAKPDDGDTQFFPRGLLSLQRTILARESSSLTNRVSLALDAVLDPTLGEVRSVFTLDAALTGSVRSKFTQQASVGASTPAFEDEDPDRPELAATAVSANAMLGYRLSEGFQIETGVRYSARAQEAFTADAQFTDGQLFWFVGFRTAINLGLDDQSPAWAL
jgi:hypothetical protein